MLSEYITWQLLSSAWKPCADAGRAMALNHASLAVIVMAIEATPISYYLSKHISAPRPPELGNARLGRRLHE